jgi:hypothetical protein
MIWLEGVAATAPLCECCIDSSWPVSVIKRGKFNAFGVRDGEALAGGQAQCLSWFLSWNLMLNLIIK